MGVQLVPTFIQPSAISRARELRRDMTDGERRLWAELREFRRFHGVHVRRQAPIGPYVADFVIHEHRLVIEVDGEHHLTPARQARDRIRDEWFRVQGYRTLRIERRGLDDAYKGCTKRILSEIGALGREATPTPSPFPQGGGESGPRR